MINHYLSAAELDAIKEGFHQGRSAVAMARELKRGVRTVAKYYALIRNRPHRHDTVDVGIRAARQRQRAAVRPDRFYTSNFEPS